LTTLLKKENESLKYFFRYLIEIIDGLLNFGQVIFPVGKDVPSFSKVVTVLPILPA